MTSLKDVQGQSTPLASSLLLPCTTTLPLCDCQFSFHMILHRQFHWRTRPFATRMPNKKKSWLLRFHEAARLKNMHASCVDVSLHLISIGAAELQHLPCMQPSYIHNSGSHSLSIWMSLSRTIHCTYPPSFKPHLFPWPFFPVTTHKPKLCTVTLK